MTAVKFGDVPANTTSAVKTVYLYNYQLTPLTVSPLSVRPLCHLRGHVQSQPGGELANCTILLTLTPTVLGAVPATSLRSPPAPRTVR